MTKCLFKALKAVDLEKYVGLFRSLGYESAGALAHFCAEHFEKLNFNEQELLRLIALLDVLKEATRDGKICPHYFNSTKTNSQQSNIKSTPIHASWSDETIVQQRNFQSNLRKQQQQSKENIKPKRSTSSIGIIGRSSSTLTAPNKPSSNEFISQRSSTVLSRQHPMTPTKLNNQRFLGPKSFLNRPAVQHVKVKSYNYGIPTNRRSRNTSYRSNNHHGSIFVSSPRHTNDLSSYGKPAEIYVYARKRPLLSTESNFQDTITVPDNKRIIIAENKANLDCTPLLKKTEFQFDHVFGSNASNKEIFESTVLPLISPNHRHNLTYICFGQTGSGKSHTIFGGKNTDGLLVYCTQLLLQETLSLENSLICSFYEIYNNQVYDLVNAGKRLFVREDGEHHVNVIGISELVLSSLDDLHCIIDDGLTRRHHGKSAFNSNSSRSHAIFQIQLKNNYNASESFRLIFIDLAGSERATDAQNNQRQTRREGAQINWSLLALKECIRSMDMTHSHAPFRQSKLTHILRDSLIGSKTRTCLMANVSPPDDCCQCSLNTLQYASRIRDISIRHRHRLIPPTTTINNKMNYFNELIKEQDKSQQRNFKPTTVSTPVHRFISTIDQQNFDIHLTKPDDIDWQIDDDNIPINDNNKNHSLKILTTSTREFMSNSSNKQTNNNNNNHLISKKISEIDDNPSSYFPLPQSDIKKSSSHSFNNSNLMYDNGNERQWKVVPAPTTNHHSGSRIIPVAPPIHMSDDNLYSSTTGTESLGTKITKVAKKDQRHKKSNIIESLNLYKQYDTGTTDTEQMIYSDRQETPRDETGFYNNRNKLLSIVSSRLTPVNKRSSSSTSSSSVIKSKNSKINSSYLNKSKLSNSSSTKIRQKPRLIKSASSTTSLASLNQEKKSSIDTKKSKISLQKFDPNIRRTSTRHHHHQRAVPLRVHHSSDSDEQDKLHNNIQRRKGNTSHSTRSEVGQTINDDKIKKDEQLSLPPPTTTPVQISSSDQVIDQSISPNINNPWPITTSYGSPSKDFGIRVSDQLNALRTLLETRLTEPDEIKHHKKEPSILQTSPGTFARQFLQSLRQTEFNNNNNNDDDKEVERNFPSNQHHHHHYEQILQPSLSSFSDELNQARVSSTSTPTSSSTIESNLVAKIDIQEPRMLSSQTDGIHSYSLINENYQTTSQNPYTGTSSGNSSSNNSPILNPSSNVFDNEIGSSFDALLNSLKNMREKDLDFIVRNSDDKLISVVD